ncbi:MAG: hypothetical protein JRJ65_04305 [Deltaproteobacteria bacterium]|nr:hypothetical protein [Deltaproteobacteria bacterium]
MPVLSKSDISFAPIKQSLDTSSTTSNEKSGVVSLKITIKNQKEAVIAVLIMKLLIERKKES